MRIAIVYDWIDKWGGVERILLTFHEIFPQADFYTSYFDEKKAYWAKDLNIKTSFIQQMPSFIRGSRITSLPFYPFAFESFNFNNYDLVISVTSSFAKSIITQPRTFHLCYLLTPARFLWSHESDYLSGAVKKLIRPYLNYLKNWDKTVAQRPDKIISISKTVADRCRKYYDRESDVIYPPFDLDYWSSIKLKVKSQKSKVQVKNKKFYLVVARLEQYKKVDLVVQMFKRLNSNLIVIGKGSQEEKLKRIASSNIQFVKDISDEELAYLYSKAQALIMPQEEDFGYVSLESQFFGCPVIAYKKGGAMETVVDGKTGLFFNQQSVESLRKTVERFNKIGYNLRYTTLKFGANNVTRFSKTKFVEKFNNIISIEKI